VNLVMTLLVRDEADIVAEHLRYHFDAGVDFVIATDHGSVDGTTEILRAYERDGRLLLIRTDEEFQQAEWVTRMARVAAAERGADWVINADADEFWWPRRGTLKEVLAAVPPAFGVVRTLMRHFAPRPTGLEPFFERMIVRHPSVTARDHVFQAQVKMVHRGTPEVSVTRGNHDAYGDGLRVLREWFPIEVLHFPIRTVAQMRNKYTRRKDRPAFFVEAVRRLIDAEGVEATFARFAVDDERLARGLADGTLALDVRLRDLLRRLGSDSTASDRQSANAELEAERQFIADVASFMRTESASRIGRRLDELEERLAALA